MAYIHRRTFLERLSLGAGAALLSPLVGGLVSEARGAVSVGTRKRLIIVSISNGMNFSQFTPQDLPPDVKLKNNEYGGPMGMTSSFTLPMMFEPLTPWRNQLVMLDGFVNQQGDGGHSTGYSAFSCVPNAGSGGENGTPGGKTIDQHVAEKIGGGTAFASVHLGARSDGSDKLVKGFWAKGKDQPVPVQASPLDAYKALFAGLSSGGNMSGPSPDVVERRKLLDYLADDIKRVQGSLAGRERAKLDEYLASVQDIGSRVSALEQAGQNGKCGATEPAAAVGHQGQQFAVQMQLATAALTCGLTNVMTVSMMGLGASVFIKSALGYDSVSLHDIGHGAHNGEQAMPKLTKLYMGHVAEMITKLQSVREGDKSIFDNAVVMVISDAAEQHHCRAFRWPVLLLGNAGGKLKVDGRYIRYPTRAKTSASVHTAGKGPSDTRALGDLYSTLGHALGAPIDDFGKGGLEKVTGPLPELLA